MKNKSVKIKTGVAVIFILTAVSVFFFNKFLIKTKINNILDICVENIENKKISKCIEFISKNYIDDFGNTYEKLEKQFSDFENRNSFKNIKITNLKKQIKIKSGDSIIVTAEYLINFESNYLGPIKGLEKIKIYFEKDLILEKLLIKKIDRKLK
jgi:hypothetical protein